MLKMISNPCVFWESAQKKGAVGVPLGHYEMDGTGLQLNSQKMSLYQEPLASVKVNGSSWLPFILKMIHAKDAHALPYSMY